VEQVHTSLIKLGPLLDAPIDRLRGHLQPRRRERIAQEEPADRTDKRSKHQEKDEGVL
jgi:hypothetical protein